MMNNKKAKISKKLWFLIIVVVILPTIIEVSLRRGFGLQFDRIVWYEMIDVSIVLLIVMPVFIYLLRRTVESARKLKDQLKENENITYELEEKTLQLGQMAYYDFLTGLPNRYKINHILNKLIENTHNEKHRIAVLFLYIDQFKIMNNVIGHELDDDFIIHISNKLVESVPENSIVSRYSGNEFIIILGDTTESEYSKTASNIIKLYSKPFLFEGKEIYTTANMGISIYPYHGKDAETLIKNADMAMYLASNNSGSTYQFFSSNIDEATDRTIKLVKGLSDAVEEKQLILHYQPQIDLKTGRLDGLEALVRWEHPEFGFISPGDFISLAEETGEIIPIGNWVLLKACKQTKYWQEKFASNFNIAVNVSVRQLIEPGFLDYVEDVLYQTKLDPKYLELEITESMVRDLKEAYVIFDRLKAMGVKIVIDDFGTGYSSLSVLGFLPIDYLKIDRSFTRDMIYQTKIDSIVKTIINMGKNLQLKLIAEGIEDKDQLDILREYDCNIGQGYYFSKPITASEIENNWLNNDVFMN